MNDRPFIFISEQLNPPVIERRTGDLWSQSTGFIENIGQIEPASIRYYVLNGRGGVGFGASKITMITTDAGANGPPSDNVRAKPYRLSDTPANANSGMATTSLTFEFEGSNGVIPTGTGLSPTRYNYFIGSDISGWYNDIQSFKSVEYRDLYDGIDVVYYFHEGSLKYDVIIHPGADPSAIKIRVTGHTSLNIQDGSMVAVSRNGWTLADSDLQAFYADDNDEVVRCTFRRIDPDTYGFLLEDYDVKRRLVIDPLIYSSYLGGSGRDVVYDVDIDAQGYIYMAGGTTSIDFPTQEGTFQENHGGGDYDAFVCKLRPSDGKPVYITYIGGNGTDQARGVSVDDTGNAYVTGYTESEDFPMGGPGFDQRKDTEAEAIVLKLNASGSRLLYTTFLGRGGIDIGIAIDVDPHGSAYVVGRTRSTYFPTTPNAFQRSFRGDPRWRGESFITKLTPDGGDLNYSSFLGGSEDDSAASIAIDGQGRAHITGRTGSADFTTTGDAYQPDYDRAVDAFYTVVTPDGSALDYSTYIGGYMGDSGEAIFLDDDDRVYITGMTSSDDFPVTNGSLQTEYSDGIQGFVMMFNRSLTEPVFSTYLGTSSGSGRVICKDLAVSKDGLIYVTGYTSFNNFPVSPCAVQRKLGGSDDAFVSVISQDGTSLVYSTFIGGSALDKGIAISLDENGSAVVVGNTRSIDFPITMEAQQSELTGEQATFVLRLPSDIEPPISVAGESILIDQHETVQFDGKNSTDNVGITNWTWTFEANGTNIGLYGSNPIHTFHEAGEFLVVLKVSDPTGNWATDTIGVTVVDITDPLADAGADIIVEQSTAFTLDGSNSSDNVEIVSWTWSFEHDGSEVSLYGMITQYAFDDVGMYDIELTVIDRIGNHGNDTLTVVVVDTTVPIAEAGDDVDLELGQEAVFDGSSSQDNVAITSWTWNFSYKGGEESLDGESPVYLFERPGEYEVTLVVRDEAGNQASDMVVVTVRDNVPPVAVVPADATIEVNTQILLDGSNSTDNVGIITYAWEISGPDGGTVDLDGITTSYLFASRGNYTVRLLVTDTAGNSGEASFDVDVISGGSNNGNGNDGGSSILIYIVISIVVGGLVLATVIYRKNRG